MAKRGTKSSVKSSRKQTSGQEDLPSAQEDLPSAQETQQEQNNQPEQEDLNQLDEQVQNQIEAQEELVECLEQENQPSGQENHLLEERLEVQPNYENDVLHEPIGREEENLRNDLEVPEDQLDLNSEPHDQEAQLEEPQDQYRQDPVDLDYQNPILASLETEKNMEDTLKETLVYTDSQVNSEEGSAEAHAEACPTVSAEAPQDYSMNETIDAPTLKGDRVVNDAMETVSYTIEEPVIIDAVPKLIFIVPYRDRESHYKIFDAHMKNYLQSSAVSHKILYIHQTDKRGFNRGAMKNVGYLAVRNAYPEDYKNITLVFNDVDTMPANETDISYETSPGIIKHFYGFEHTLGGIVSINAYDFERLNGFPNFWAWGYEDNLLQIRADTAGIIIDRSVFYKIHDPRIIHIVDTPIRQVNSSEFDRFLEGTKEGISSINNLYYETNEETGFVNVITFETSAQEIVAKRTDYDLRNGPMPFKNPMTNKRRPRMRMHF